MRIKGYTLFFIVLLIVVTLTVGLVDGNEVMRIKCCNDNSNEEMDMKIDNEDSIV